MKTSCAKHFQYIFNIKLNFDVISNTIIHNNNWLKQIYMIN